MSRSEVWSFEAGQKESNLQKILWGLQVETQIRQNEFKNAIGLDNWANFLNRKDVKNYN